MSRRTSVGRFMAHEKYSAFCKKMTKVCFSKLTHTNLRRWQCPSAKWLHHCNCTYRADTNTAIPPWPIGVSIGWSTTPTVSRCAAIQRARTVENRAHNFAIVQLLRFRQGVHAQFARLEA